MCVCIQSVDIDHGPAVVAVSHVNENRVTYSVDPDLIVHVHCFSLTVDVVAVCGSAMLCQ